AGEMRKLATPEYVSEEALEQAASRLEELKAFLARDLLLAALPEARTSPVAMGKDVPLVAADPAGSNPEHRQRLDQEFYARQVTQMNNSMGMQNANFNQFQNSLLVQYGTMRDGEARGVWVGPNLLLARRVLVGGQTHVVGAWWDWGEIQNWLLKNVADLLPAARLEAAGIDAAAEQPHRLATLPVRLVPGAVPVETPPGPSATIVSLAGAWVGLLLAAGAVGGLLHGTLSLSERRGAFVSAVTHELRTPLTTMRMYAEMLADGMVTDEQKRIRYLATVREETNRLCRLVENVLSYSRLEGNRRQVAPQPVDLAQLLQEVEPRLRRRASEAGMELVLGDAAAGGSATVTTDPAALEQILLNLVDNACKYAARAEDRRIHLELLREGRSAVLRVRDHGPGVPAADRERIFRPFFRAKRDSAGSFGGVGLGLAISRRLARSLGGEIRVDRSAGRGAGFSLILPGT
ncbi:MAG TPA: HAMP domain-containing sensor histidine kinase, partial [Phycisphaerae bacterium]|nr:HAMP domain-containing sensor histidine kinase [Phycisphaerae bacterium]